MLIVHNSSQTKTGDQAHTGLANPMRLLPRLKMEYCPCAKEKSKHDQSRVTEYNSIILTLRKESPRICFQICQCRIPKYVRCFLINYVPKMFPNPYQPQEQLRDIIQQIHQFFRSSNPDDRQSVASYFPQTRRRQ